MKELELRILIVGCGSIGTRHLKTFKKIKGVEVVPCDPREDMLNSDPVRPKGKALHPI